MVRRSSLPLAEIEGDEDGELSCIRRVGIQQFSGGDLQRFDMFIGFHDSF